MIPMGAQAIPVKTMELARILFAVITAAVQQVLQKNSARKVSFVVQG